MAAWSVHVADSHTGLFVRRGSKLVPYQRLEKYPLSKDRHRLLKDNAYSEQKNSCEKPQCLEPSCIEPWLDHEATLYDLPKPGNVTRQPTERILYTPDVTMTFPEDLDATFSSGLLDTTFNVTGGDPPGTNRGDEGTDEMKGGQRVVPDPSATAQECTEQSKSLYDTSSDLIIKNKSAPEDEASSKGLCRVPETPTRRDLPILFYPRTNTKPTSKRTIKIPKFSKRCRHK